MKKKCPGENLLLFWKDYRAKPPMNAANVPVFPTQTRLSLFGFKESSYAVLSLSGEDDVHIVTNS